MQQRATTTRMSQPTIRNIIMAPIITRRRNRYNNRTNNMPYTITNRQTFSIKTITSMRRSRHCLNNIRPHPCRLHNRSNSSIRTSKPMTTPQ